jgi:hypothetical protein
VLLGDLDQRGNTAVDGIHDVRVFTANPCVLRRAGVGETACSGAPGEAGFSDADDVVNLRITQEILRGGGRVGSG